MSEGRPSSSAQPCEGAVTDDKHWSGVAVGECFQFLVSFDPTVYATDTVPVAMRRVGIGVACRELQQHDYCSKTGGHSQYHVEKWARREFKPPPISSRKIGKQAALAFKSIPNSRAAVAR